MKKNVWLEAKDFLFIALGTLLYSCGVAFFMLPYKLMSGGVSGISALIYYVTGVEAQFSYLAINIFLLIAAVKILGFKFCLKTIWGVSTSTFWLWLIQRLIINPETRELMQIAGANQEFMACVLGAILEGIGLSICFGYNGSTGGTDIIAAIVNKYRNMSLGQVILACDVIIISSCYFVFHDWQRVVFGFVMMFICSMTLDYITNRNRRSVQFMIFSRNPKPIADAIVALGHGVTVLDGEGWYTHTERKVVISIVRNTEQVQIFRMIKDIDPYAFVSMSNASGVYGEGFDHYKFKEDSKTVKVQTIVFATNDADKLEEMRKILGSRFEVRSLEDIGCSTNSPINDDIISGNAVAKAKYIKRFYGFDSIAQGANPENDDSYVFALVQGDYEHQDKYVVNTFNFITQVKDYLDTPKVV